MNALPKIVLMFCVIFAWMHIKYELKWLRTELEETKQFIKSNVTRKQKNEDKYK